MTRRSRLSVLLALGLVLISGGLLTAAQSTACPQGAFFTASPLNLEDIAFIRPLGGINPSGHVFPTDHIYFYMHQDSAGVPLVVPFYAPGDLTVTTIWAVEYVSAGVADFTIQMRPCQDITVEFMHVNSLESAVFGDTTSFADWELTNEYATGGETYRRWQKETSIEVSAGQLLGSVGGRRGQYALDLGVYDSRWQATAVANVARWEESRALHAVCPFDYYANGPLRTSLLDLVESEARVAVEDRCFVVFQDEPGTARGCWFVVGTSSTFPEDPHLALISLNVRPSRYVFSVGTSIPGLASGMYEFGPYQAGKVNRPFNLITPDGTIYGYSVDRYPGTIIVTMPDADTLWIEALPEGSGNSRSWAFTDRKTMFER